MNELAKHIEVLLLENDCVIVPGLGGFIAHNRPASYAEEKHIFEPPMRTVGFNPQLIINDGLLAQSYMQTYNTDFPDATRRIEKTVNAIKEDIYREGQVKLENIGTLYYNMNGLYEFEPSTRSFFTPDLYGLEGFSMAPLAEIRRIPSVPVPAKDESKTTVSLYNWLRTTVAVAAAVLLFFILSTPVENTYIDDANFASLGSIDMFDAIRDQSVATSLSLQKQESPSKEDDKKKARNNINTLKPVKVKTETVAAKTATKNIAKAEKKTEKVEKKTEKAEKKTEKKAAGKRSYVIVASLTSNADAQRTLKSFIKDGYTDAEVVESNGRFRIALGHFSNEADAYRKVQEIRKIDSFKNAWVFTSK